MELTGKAKESFEKWYFKNHCGGTIKYKDLLPHHKEDVFGWFNGINDSFKWGVYIDFFWTYKIPLTFDFLPVIMGKETIEEAKEIQFKRCNDVLNLKLENQ